MPSSTMSDLGTRIAAAQSAMPPHLAGSPHNVSDTVTYTVTARLAWVTQVRLMPGDIWVHEAEGNGKGIYFGYITRAGEEAFRYIRDNPNLAAKVMDGVILPPFLGPSEADQGPNNADYHALMAAAQMGFTKCPEAITGDWDSGFTVDTEAGQFTVEVYLLGHSDDLGLSGLKDKHPLANTGSLSSRFQKPESPEDHGDVLDAILAGLHKDATLSVQILGLTTDGDDDDCEAMFMFRGRGWCIKVRR